METHFEGMNAEETGVSRQKIKEDFRTLMHDAEALLKATASDMSDKAREARVRLGEALEKAKVTYQGMQDKTVAAAKATDKVIREHPYETIGIAFGVGLLLGLVVSRK